MKYKFATFDKEYIKMLNALNDAPNGEANWNQVNIAVHGNVKPYNFDTFKNLVFDGMIEANPKTMQCKNGSTLKIGSLSANVIYHLTAKGANILKKSKPTKSICELISFLSKFTNFDEFMLNTTLAGKAYLMDKTFYEENIKRISICTNDEILSSAYRKFLRQKCAKEYVNYMEKLVS